MYLNIYPFSHDFHVLYNDNKQDTGKKIPFFDSSFTIIHIDYSYFKQ